MDTVCESSTTHQKPVIVRVKRKLEQSQLDAFCLEINEERQFKRTKKLLVRYLETLTDSETKTDIDRKRKLEDPKISNARFEQIWPSRKGGKELHDHDKSRGVYDVVRVEDDDEAAEFISSLKNQKKLSRYLPLLREFIPTAAQEIEADDDHHTQGEDTYVYDCYYADVNEQEMDIGSMNQFPLVKVKDGEGGDEPSDEYEYDSDDSETYVMYEYPAQDVKKMRKESEENKEFFKKTCVGPMVVLGDGEFYSFAENGEFDSFAENGDRENDEDSPPRRPGEVCVPSGDRFILF